MAAAASGSVGLLNRSTNLPPETSVALAAVTTCGDSQRDW